MSTQTQRDSTTDAGLARLLLDAAKAEADAIRAINSGFPINVLREKKTDKTDPLLTPSEIEALRWVAKFGWVRWPMLARLMWPASPASSARVLAMRMIRDLAAEKLIYPVIGGDGHDVFLMAALGAAYLRTYFPGLYARDLSVGRRGLTAGTRQTSPAGATFIHRLITNAYLADAVANGRLIATEYEQLVNTEEWRTSWHQVGYRAKRCDGLTSRVGPMPDEHGVILLDIEVIEMLRTSPKESLTRNDKGALVVQDDMGRLLMSLRQHSANGQRVTILLLDDRPGHGIARNIVSVAAKRGIPISSQFVRFVFVSMRPGKPILGPFRRVPWPGGQRAVVAPPAAANTTRTSSASSGPTGSPATTPASTSASATNGLSAPALTVRRTEFRLVSDERLANGNRDAIIQHVPTGITAQGSTGGRLKSADMEFAFFDPDDEPLFFDAVACRDNIDLTDPVEFQELCDELRQVISDADGDVDG
jgi:hypothetical protein